MVKTHNSKIFCKQTKPVSNLLVRCFNILVCLHVHFQLTACVECLGTLRQSTHPALRTLVQAQMRVQIVYCSKPPVAIILSALEGRGANHHQ